MREMEAGRPPEIKRSRKPARPVKREVNQEMKSFAESTMNELLGWYGYEEVDLRDVSGAENRKPCVKRHVSVLREKSVPSAEAEAACLEKERPGQRGGAKSRAVAGSSSLSPSTSSSEAKEPRPTHVIVPLIKPSAVEEVQSVLIVCVWCQREGVRRFSLLMGRQLKSFCSEKCFFACRRAHFKRNKANDSSCHGDESPAAKEEEGISPTPIMKCSNNNKVCDWCKRLQPTQQYVSTGTGDERLHFCSSECVNQYKMDVFYREARAALTARPSAEERSVEVKDSKVKEGSPKSPLLTPASWTRPSKPAHSPKSPLAPSSSSPSSSSTSEPIGVCKRTSLSHTSTPPTSSLPCGSSSNQERFTITRATVPRPPTPPPQPQCSPLPPPPPPALIIRPQTPHTLSLHTLSSHTPPSPSLHTHSPPHTLATGQTRPSLPPPHPQPPPTIAPPIPTPAFPAAPMMHLPPGCPPLPPPLMLPHVPRLPPPFPQNTLLVPYPIIIPLPLPVPIPLPLPLPAGLLTHSSHSSHTSGSSHTPLASLGSHTSHTSLASHTSLRTMAHTPPTDEGHTTHTLAGVCVKAEDEASPHTDANAHSWAQETTEGGSTHSQAEGGDEGKEKGGVEEEREVEDEEEEVEEDEREVELEEREEDEEEEEVDEEDGRTLLVNGQREQWREESREESREERSPERRVIQCLTGAAVLSSDSDGRSAAGERDGAGEPARSTAQHSPAHTPNTSTPVLQHHTLSPHTHVIHLTHTAQTVLMQNTHTHTHTTSAVQGLAADQTHSLHSPHITHTNSSHTHLPTVPGVAACAVSQTVAMPRDSTHKLSPPPESPESPSVDLKENRTERCHELTEGQVSESGGCSAEEESVPKDEEHTDCQHTPDRHTHTHTLKRAHTQIQPHTPSVQQHSQEDLEEKRCCLQSSRTHRAGLLMP
ncbi:hypothetical protein ACEWY4_021599 [Coilia grayii]|uniref:Sine oculis-binding protein homolog n=1 Tax=Coilia grayii TaxID=363190 RepID=A0ABD1J586_9TELE